MIVNTLEAHPIVLVVDDEPLLRLVNADALMDAGYQVIEASSGDEAIAVLERNRDVRVVFTDVEMPGFIDGFALAGRIALEWPAISVVVTSGRRFPAASFNAPARRFLPKPYSMEHMVQTVGACVDARH